jgi:hypothetical protein
MTATNLEPILITKIIKCPSFCFAKIEKGVCLYQKIMGKCLYPKYRMTLDYELLNHAQTITERDSNY